MIIPGEIAGKFDPKTAKLTRQSYGIAMAQVTFGGPRGVWLECGARSCNESARIVGKGAMDAPDSEVAKVFRRYGWTGHGDAMTHARCPAHSK